MSYVPYPANTESGFTIDGSRRSSSRTTLFDGKILNAENTNRWDTKGTGTATYNVNNGIDLNVTAGQYLVRQSKFFTPYFSGKPQQIESTSFNFQNQANVIKRIGYFSSNAVAPYNSNKDGVWLEADGTTYRLICSNNGVETHNIPWTSWDAYSSISTYDWSKFTVTEIDFLWLGGAGLRLFLVVDGVFKLVHTIKNHAGFATQTIFKSPQQPTRYEIRSTTGTGTLTSVCSQVSSEGGKDEQGEGVTITNYSKDANVVGTNYLICAARKTSAHRDRTITLDYMALGITGATSDSGVVMLCLNPTFSATPTWTANSRLEEATPTNAGEITVTNLGRVLRSFPIVSSSTVNPGPLAALKTLGMDIDNTPGVLALVYRPTTATQVVTGSMMFLEY